MRFQTAKVTVQCFAYNEIDVTQFTRKFCAILQRNQPFGLSSSQLMISLSSLTNTYVYNIVKTNSKKHLFHSISMTYHVDLTKQRLT